MTVTSVLQTTAGKMIFCRWPEAASQPERERREAPAATGAICATGATTAATSRRETDRPPERAPAAEPVRGADASAVPTPPAAQAGAGRPAGRRRAGAPAPRSD